MNDIFLFNEKYNAPKNGSSQNINAQPLMKLLSFGLRLRSEIDQLRFTLDHFLVFITPSHGTGVWNRSTISPACHKRGNMFAVVEVKRWKHKNTLPWT